MKRLAVVILAIAIFGSVGPVSAAEYGAIAFSQQNGASGYSYGYDTRAAAERAAFSQCRRNSSRCKIVSWFKNACAVLAKGDGNGYGTAWAARRDLAEKRAMNNCHAHTDSCRVAVWVCSK